VGDARFELSSRWNEPNREIIQSVARTHWRARPNPHEQVSRRGEAAAGRRFYPAGATRKVRLDAEAAARLRSAGESALDEAKAKVAAGDLPGALALYRETWERVVDWGDHGHAGVAAHMAGVAEPDPEAKLQWNLNALREAEADSGHPLVATFSPSLYNNPAFSYELIGDRAQALRYSDRGIVSGERARNG
jgi:hypothetical protein